MANNSYFTNINDSNRLIVNTFKTDGEQSFTFSDFVSMREKSIGWKLGA